MGNKRISELPAAAALTGAEKVEVVQGGVNVQTTAQAIADLGGVGGGTSGAYTPTLTNNSNVASSTPTVCMFTRVGDVVRVTGYAVVAASVTATITNLRISLPVASNLGAADSYGLAHLYSASVFISAVVFADTTNDAANIQFISNGTGSYGCVFDFSYNVI